MNVYKKDHGHISPQSACLRICHSFVAKKFFLSLFYVFALCMWDVGRKRKDMALQREKGERWMLGGLVLKSNSGRELVGNEEVEEGNCSTT